MRRHRAAGAACLATALAVAGFNAIAGAPPAGATVQGVHGTDTPAPQVRTTTSYSVLIGPLRARGGFTIQLEVDGCGTPSSRLLVDYAEGNRAAALDHSYSGPAPHCRVSERLGDTILNVSWGRVLRFDLDLTGTGRLDLERVHSSCGTSFFESRSARSAGRAVIAIHPRALGHISFSRVSAHILGEGSTGCDSDTGAGTLPLSGIGSDPSFGTSLPPSPRAMVTAGPTAPTSTGPAKLPTIAADGSGSRFAGVFDPSQSLVITASSLPPDDPLTILTDQSRDSPASGVTGTMSVALSSTDAFTADHGDSGAQLVADAVFAKGILTFTATRDCTRVTNALDGNLTGTIVVRDPIFGTVSYRGSTALDAAVGNADASLETC